MELTYDPERKIQKLIEIQQYYFYVYLTNFPYIFCLTVLLFFLFVFCFSLFCCYCLAVFFVVVVDVVGCFLVVVVVNVAVVDPQLQSQDEKGVSSSSGPRNPYRSHRP